MRLATIFLFMWIAAFSLTGAWPTQADNKEPPVSSLIAAPATIKLPRFDPSVVAETSVIARTTALGRLPADLELSFTASPGLEVKIGERVAKAGDIVWPVHLRATGDPPDLGIVDFRLSYAAIPKGAGAASPATKVQVQRASLSVQIEPGLDTSPAGDAEVSIRTDSTDISEDVPIRAYLLVKNTSNQPFKVEALEIDKPKFLNVDHALKPTVVAAHGALRLPLDISIAKPEKPRIGEWLVLASVSLTRGGHPREQQAIAFAEQKVKVGVPGVSDVLKIFDLPSLLLVPGALLLATWSLLGADKADKNKWLEWKSLNFWLVAITLSIFIFIIQDRFRLGPNFLVAYGVGDVAGLWLGCVGLGVSSFGAYRVGVWSRRRFRDWRTEQERRASEPLPNEDKPIDILKKLLQQNLPVVFPRISLTVNGRDVAIFKTAFKASDGQVWAVPRMLYQKAPNEPDGTALTELLTKIDVAKDVAAERPAPLFALLEKGLEDNQITFEWEKDYIRGPCLLPVEMFRAASAPEPAIGLG